MGFLINCTNKGCYKSQEAYLDLSDNEVYCSECGKMIPNINHFTKSQMKTLNQVRKNNGRIKAYAQRCNSCKNEDLPKLINNKLACSKCSKELPNISKPFEILIREAIKKGNDEL